WFRNTWSEPSSYEAEIPKPSLTLTPPGTLLADHATLGKYRIAAAKGPRGTRPRWLFTENETNSGRMVSPRVNRPSCKDAFHLFFVEGMRKAINPQPVGTKAAAHYVLNVPAGREVQITLRLAPDDGFPESPFGEEFDQLFEQRILEADAYYDLKVGAGLNSDER